MLNNKGNGHGKMGIPAGLPLLQKTIKKQCYVCGNDMQVDPKFERVEVMTCQQCEIQKNVFLLNLYKQARIQGMVAAERARQEQAAQPQTGEQPEPVSNGG